MGKLGGVRKDISGCRTGLSASVCGRRRSPGQHQPLTYGEVANGDVIRDTQIDQVTLFPAYADTKIQWRIEFEVLWSEECSSTIPVGSCGEDILVSSRHAAGGFVKLLTHGIFTHSALS